VTYSSLIRVGENVSPSPNRHLTPIDKSLPLASSSPLQVFLLLFEGESNYENIRGHDSDLRNYPRSDENRVIEAMLPAQTQPGKALQLLRQPEGNVKILNRYSGWVQPQLNFVPSRIIYSDQTLPLLPMIQSFQTLMLLCGDSDVPLQQSP